MAGHEGRSIRSLRTSFLNLPPSCVEFCPAFPSYFLVGTYSLQAESTQPINADADELSQAKKPQSRNGSIITFRLVDGELTHLQTVPQPSALLDLRFNPHDGSSDVCAVVSSTATLALFRLCPDDKQPLKHLHTMSIAAMSHNEISPPDGGEVLFLAFAWHPSRANMMAITTSAGFVYLVRLPTLNGDWELHPEPVITHMLETWCVAISHAPAALEQSQGTGETGDAVFRVYSGGDDSALRFRTCSWAGGSVAGDMPTLESRGHDAGVTAILPLFWQEADHELVVTGSYDEHVRLFSVPLFGKPKKLAKLRLGGGVWRLKLIDLDSTPNQEYNWRARILASCMHAGARVIELRGTNDGDYQFNILGRFEEHKSMNYGSDFRPGWKDKMFIVSTSFYDKLLCLWEFKMK